MSPGSLSLDAQHNLSRSQHVPSGPSKALMKGTRRVNFEKVPGGVDARNGQSSFFSPPFIFSKCSIVAVSTPAAPNSPQTYRQTKTAGVFVALRQL